MSKTNDVSQSPDQPQFALGISSDEAVTRMRLARSPLEGPGGIVKLLGQQYQLPRADNPHAETDATISRDTHGLPNG